MIELSRSNDLRAASVGQSARYCLDPYRYVRRRTHVVKVGEVAIGGDYPIRVQSMTTTLTQDINGTVAQALRLIEAGCELVRVTTPTTQDAKALGEIRRRLRAAGMTVPVVADVHFNPATALEAAHHAEKVRINPGNYADKKAFSVRDYTEAEYATELARIDEKFRPLVRLCKSRGVAMRIGTNHGSLSDRIMNRFGDTPEGMVESALEFLAICEDEGYREVIFSMKASNPKVMVQAYRLLVARLDADGRGYPIHLGVTEAGGGQDGRIKSAIGIGALLEDGIGDTIRVSLTEEPEAEIPVALALARRYTPAAGHDHSSRPISRLPTGRAAEPDWPASALTPPALAPLADRQQPSPATEPAVIGPLATLPDRRDPFHYGPRPVAEFAIGPTPYGGRRPTRVVVTLPDYPSLLPDPAGALQALLMPVGPTAQRPDLVVVPVATADDLPLLEVLAHQLTAELAAPGLIVDVSADPTLAAAVASTAGALRLKVPVDTPLTVIEPVLSTARHCFLPIWVEVDQPGDQASLRELAAGHHYPAVDFLLALVERSAAAGQRALVLGVSAADRSYLIWSMRLLDSRLREVGADYPLHLCRIDAGSADEALLDHSVGLGALLIDGIGQSVALEGRQGRARRLQLAFDILQGSGARASKTEFIACPSCGRTLFDLQTTTARIQARTGHLVGVKIAVMGCVVNGLGELADADFGYMGSGVGKVNLFVGKECVEKNLPAEIADERLIELIKAHDRWVEPPQ